MKTVARFLFPYEAQIVRAKLESEGIMAFVADEHTINAYWLYSYAMGGVRVQVHNSNVSAALEVLARDYSKDLVEEVGEDLVVCPECDGTDIVFHTKGKVMAYVVFLFLQFPLWPFRHKVYCKLCGEINAPDP